MSDGRCPYCHSYMTSGGCPNCDCQTSRNDWYTPWNKRQSLPQPIGKCPICGNEYNILTDICWGCGLGDEEDIPRVHLNADKNLKPETAESLGEMIRCTLDAIKQGKLGKRDG